MYRLAAVALLGCSTMAHAQEPPVPKPGAVENVLAWNGPWVAAMAGGGKSARQPEPTFPIGFARILTSTGTLSLAAGWNYRIGHLVLGPVMMVSHHFGGSRQPDIARTATSLGARLGAVLFDRAMIYGTAGTTLRAQRLNAFVVDWFSVSLHEVKNGLTVGYFLGAGVEFAIAPKWNAIVEYRYSNYGTSRFQGPIVVGPNTYSVNAADGTYSHTLQGGISYSW